MRLLRSSPHSALLVGLLVLPAMMAPGVAAADAVTLRFTSPDALIADGALAASTSAGGSAFAHGYSAGNASFVNLTGEVRVWEWTEPHSETPAVHTSTRYEPASVTRFPLAGARVEWVFGDEWHRFVVNPLDDGRVTASAHTSSTGHPAFLVRDEPHGPSEGPTPSGKAEEVRWAWRAGWPFVANASLLDGDLEGWPASSDTMLTGQGRVLFHLFGGNVTLAHANGSREVIRLGNWTEDAETVHAGPVLATPTFHVRRLVFEGHVDAFTLSAREDWGLGGPTVDWTLDGRATWTDATGNATTPSGSRAFEGATVDGKGHVSWTAAASGPVPSRVWPISYEVHGEWDWLAVDASAVVTARATSTAAFVATGAVLTVLTALLFDTPRAFALRFVVPLYSRIAPADLLSHPRRGEITTIVNAEPGIHLRELHRRVGGGWGGFRAHLRLLKDGGYLRIVKRGGYALAFPAMIGSARAHSLSSIPHPVQRALFDAVPVDGSAVPVPDLADAVGVTRQLARYHVKKLMRDGFIEEAPGSDRRSWVRRADRHVQSAPDAAAATRAPSVTEA